MALESSGRIVYICCWLASNVASQPSIFQSFPRLTPNPKDYYFCLWGGGENGGGEGCPLSKG